MTTVQERVGEMMWNGRPVVDMTKEELIAALYTLGCMVDMLQRQASQDLPLLTNKRG